MLSRGEGYLLNTVSAAGLLNQLDGAPDGVNRRAAIGQAESLTILRKMGRLPNQVKANPPHE
jgi:hypothetical protein